MKILAFDISGAACSVALGKVDLTNPSTLSILGEEHKPMTQGQPNALFPLIQSLMTRTNTPVDSLDAIAVTRGPGSFTGIRAGLAAAKGLCLGRNLPLIGLSTFDLYASRASLEQFPLLVAIESKRADLYVQLYNEPNTPLWGDGDALELPALAERLQKYSNLTLIGDGQHHLQDVHYGKPSPNIQEIRASHMLLYLAVHPQALNASCTPLYLRPALVAHP